MKIRISPRSRQTAAALFFTVIILVFTAVMLVTYFELTAGEYVDVERSQVWNAALVNAEAGVEEGLAMVNTDQSGAGTVTNWASLATTSGWDTSSTYTNVYPWLMISTNPIYHMYRTNANSGYRVGSGGYDVYVNSAETGTNGPEIYAVGYANWVGAATTANRASREIYVKTAPISQLFGGIVAQQGINFNGNNVTIDSWDSSTNTHSIWQTNLFYRKNFYSAGTNYGVWSPSLSFVSNNIASSPSRMATVNVFTDGGILDVGVAQVAGNIETGPGGTAEINNKGSVGDLAWVFKSNGSLNNTGIQPGHSRTDANKLFHSYDLPNPTNSWQTTWLQIADTPVISIGGSWTNSGGAWSYVGGKLVTNTASGYLINGTYYSIVVTNRLQNTNWVYYEYPSQLENSVFVDAQYVVLYLPNGLKYASSDTFTVNTNADIQIWSTGDISTSGNAVLNNVGAYGRAFSLYDVAGYPINISLGGNAFATGYYYLPSSSLQFSGNGGTYDVAGAIICYDINIGGNYNFHFDQALRTDLPTDRYTATVWKEIDGY